MTYFRFVLPSIGVSILVMSTLDVGLAILSLTLAFNIVGDSLRDFLDPRLR